MRSLTPSAFTDDDGLADPAVRRALGAAVAEPGVRTYLAAVAALCAARVLVAVVARPTDTETIDADGPTHGLTRDKHSAMSVVLLRTADGRLGMLTFTGTDALRAWDPAARPVPTTLDVAAQAAHHDGADTMVVDLQGPHPLVIDGEVLGHLASGHRLMALADGEFGWAVPQRHETQPQGHQHSEDDRSGPAV